MFDALDQPVHSDRAWCCLVIGGGGRPGMGASLS
jgi:hypothetical protein